jgi:hypothetical protein|tara:strand:- start:380 stop:547 length:168 start_codon:yes stop_codon:yes gene_type:complete
MSNYPDGMDWGAYDDYQNPKLKCGHRADDYCGCFLECGCWEDNCECEQEEDDEDD